jgi:hypothetical protein
MVGRAGGADYRRPLLFLSRADYKRFGKIYSEILAGAIVQSATGPYHAAVRRRNKFCSRKEVDQQ